MKKAYDYRIVASENSLELEKMVNLYLEEGYQLHGHLLVAKAAYVTKYIQPMVKYEESSDEYMGPR